ncbi:hypothetical protein PF008_g15084 [Phytophthora fragariae]|uniref:Uncharacterized protein n=1 Tax=Phytophthora fragariae TaxID=53985 RepID=A0A6G0RF56_9STRA|nr:hypothetical protein PF008_g15084 [Phytophthora fragariae]
MSTAAPTDSRTDTIEPHGNPPRADAAIAASASEPPLAASASDPAAEHPSSDSAILAGTSETSRSGQERSIPPPANSDQASNVTRRLLGSLRDAPDDSGGEYSDDDSAWEPVSADEADASSVEGDVVDEEGSCASSEESSLDESIISCDDDLRARVTALIQADACDDHCLRGKVVDLEHFLMSLDHMSPNEKKQSVLTALALLMKTDTAVRRRGTGVRQTFTYYLPLVGRVCRDTWCSVYGVSTATITRYRRQIQAGAFSVQAHRGKMNLNASKIDIRWLAQWFRGFASTLGDTVPVRVRSQKTIDGVVRKRYSAEDYTLLPAFFTWDQLYTEMQNYVAENEMAVRMPQPSTFRKLLQSCCPTIRIRSPRSNVCDVCSILYSRMKSGVTADLTEELGVHTTAAKTMRYVALDTSIISIRQWML